MNAGPPNTAVSDNQGLPRLGWAVWLASGFGVGLAPMVPGTFGSLVGLALAHLIYLLPSLLWQALVLVGLLAVGFPLCGRAARYFGTDDPQAIVWDELSTVPLVFFLVPVQSMRSPAVLLLGFVLHRFFDIVKFPPANWAERLSGGWGIMLDDVVAAVYGWMMLHALLWWWGGS